MADPRRSDPSPTAGRAGRDSRAESLLVEGLDLYFAGRFEDAVHLWTRVLFLDRSHARARAYIDRARTAMAERQRRADEWLRTSEDMLAQGQVEAARLLLSRVVETTGDDEPTSALRGRLERVERAHAATEAARAKRPAVPEPIPGWTWPHRSVSIGLAGLAMLAAVLLVGLAAGPIADGWFGQNEGRSALVAEVSPARLPVLTSADAALIRARTLYTRGRPAEALQALDRVGPESPGRAEADRMRIEIQQLLLATSRVPANGSPPR